METAVTYPYQDASLPIESRVEDLLSRMDVEDKAGMLFHPLGTVGDLDGPGIFGMPNMRKLLDRKITHYNILDSNSARELAEWYNALQRDALSSPLPIPVTISSDPRHSFAENPGAAIAAGPFSQWPEPLGFAAIGDVALVEQFADIVRREYLATGIRVALHPQLDLPSDARWARAYSTFGSDADLSGRLGVAYIRGLQGEQVGPDSVSAMVKHFPGGGAQLDGEDPHFDYGREQAYPGNNFELHLEPFRKAIAAGVAQMMPYYGMPVGTKYEEVGFGFNKGIITDLLRGELGYDGIVCADWGILSRTFWGVEDLTFEERMIKSLDAGIDQWGGEFRPDVLVSLIKAGRIQESRVDVSVRRLLTEKFRLGLFDNPFVDVAFAEANVGLPETREAGVAAQAAAQTLLKNAAGGIASLPLARGLKIYAEGLDAAAVAPYGTVVTAPADADVALVRLVAPWEDRTGNNPLEQFFHAGSLEFSAEQIAHLADLSEQVPVVVDVFFDRPALIGQIEPYAAGILVNFGSSDLAFARVIFGEAAPQGNLPFEVPSSMEAVRNGLADVPNDTVAPAYPVGFGLRYERTTD